MKFPRKLALGIGAFLALVLVALVAIPLFFGDRIVARLKDEIGNNVAARVDWTGAGLSLLRDFPNATLTVSGLSVANEAPFAGDTLVAMDQARLVLDLGSVVGYLRRGEQIVVREVALAAPDVRLRVLGDGRANWDIMRAKDGAAGDSSAAIGISLRDLSITDGRVTLDDQQARLSVAIHGLQESLSGDFAQERFALATRTRADTVSVSFAGVPYLSRANLDVTAELDADLPANRFTIRDAALRLNNLALKVAGSVATGTPDMALDLAFSAPSTAFRDILSLVPAIYANDFAKLQATGTMTVAGQVRGNYGPESFPALAIRAKVENGVFRYPDLPLPARDIAMELNVDNPGGDVDRTVVNLKRFHAVIGNRPLDAALVMRTPVSDPDVDLRVVGALDLADVARTVKLDGVDELKGQVAANVAVKTRLSDIDQRRYDRVDARGTVNLARVALRSATLPHPVAVDTAALRLTPRTAELSSFVAKIGSSDVRATGTLDNILGFVFRGDDLRGTATVASRHLDLDEWRSDEALTVIPVPPRIDFALNASAEQVKFATLTASNVRGGVKIKDQRATLDELRLEMLAGSMVASGWYETIDVKRPTFDIDLRVASVDVPSAFAALNTVQKLAPVAKWAKGQVSGTVALRGAVLPDMSPELTTLGGTGSIQTDRLALEGMPLLGKLADALSFEQVRNPALGALRASFDIANGRLQVKPFTTKLDETEITVAGSNGIDQTIRYDLALAVPRGRYGAGLTRLVSQAKQAGTDLSTGEVVKLGAQVAGTITDPSVKVDFASTAQSVREAAQSVVQAGIEQRTEAVRERADSAAEAARRRAREEADRVVAEAEEQAAKVRAEARELAEKMRSEANTRADSLMARATSPAAKIAAKAATDRVRKEADEKAEQLVRTADARADGIVAAARQRADALAPPQ